MGEDRDFEWPDNFRELFEKLYDGFPNGRLSEDVVREVIVTNEDTKFLVEHGYLLEEQHQVDGTTVMKYNLGPEGLNLISSWRMEDLTQKMAHLTYLIAALTVVNIVVALI